MTELRIKPFFTIQDAEKEGISKRMLSYYVDKGVIERLEHGLYRYKDSNAEIDIKWYDLAVAAKSVKNGVICLASALVYYDLSDDFLNEYWIAIPHSRSRQSNEKFRFVRMRDIELGVKKIKLSGIEVEIFDPERTIIDSFRLLDLETAIKALKAYLSGTKVKPNLRKLKDYSKKLRQDISPYIETIIT